MHRENSGGTVRAQRSRRASARFRAAAAAIEALEARRLLCFVHDGRSDGIAMSTIGFEPMPSGTVSAEPAAAAPSLPDLHSRPSAPTAIYLDFDGDAVTNTDPYSEDADATTFNATEAANITEAWHEMATYFAMFDVDVTTTKPAVGFPTAWIAIGNNISNAYSQVNVFPNPLGSTSGARSWANSSFARTRVSGIAHEIGHNFGLYHQADFNHLGVLEREYSSGYDLLHGPIMGADFAQDVHKWFIGHPSNSATRLQDDLARIAVEIKPYQPPGGDGFAADDFGNTIAAASALTLSGSSLTTSGVIERLYDVDAFSFTVAAPEAFQLLATPHGVSGVDLKLGVYASDGTLIAMKDSATTNFQDLTLALEPGTYYTLLSSHGNYGDVGQYDLSVQPLPAGWDTQDIGAHKRPGSASYDPATAQFTLSSSGSTYDNFRFAYQTLTGDGSVTARVDSLSGSIASRAAGVMLRPSLATNSPFLWAHARGSSGSGWSYRLSTGGSVTVPSGTTTFTAPYWVRITRSGSQVTAAKSPDGINWSNLQTLTMTSGPVYIGLAASAFSSTSTATAVMSNVALTGELNAPPAYNALSAPTGVTVAPQASGIGMTVSWDDVADESGYLIERSSDGITWAGAIGTTAANVTSFNDNAPPGALRYFYRVSARDASGGRSAPSAVASAVNRPSAVTHVKTMSISTSTVVVDWRDTDGEAGYRVERSADDGVNWTTLGILGANVPSYTATGLLQGTTYLFRITPTSAIGDGAATSIAAQSRLNAVTGLSLVSAASNQVKLAWNGSVPFASGYKVLRSTNGTTFSTIATLGDVTTYTDSTVTPLNKYYYRVAAYNALTESVNGATLNVATASAAALPSGWNAINIGNIGSGASGMSSTGSSATIIGSGAIASGHQFLFRQTNGDGEIIARVNTLDGTTSSMTAGLMFRSSLSVGASYVYLQASWSNVRITASGGTFSGQVSGADPIPVWLKLVRSGTSLTGYFSPDGVTWTSVGTSNNALPTGPLLVGLLVTPQNSTAMIKGSFGNISGSALAVADTVAPATPAFTPISSDTGASASDRVTSDNTLVLNGVAEPASWVTITRAGVGAIATVQANYLGNFSFDYTGTPLPDGTHTFTATARDGSNNVSAPTGNFVVTVDRTPPAPAAWTFNVATQRVEISYGEALHSTSVGSGDLMLLNVTTGQSIAPSQWSYLAASQTATYGTGATLADGHWRATLNAGSVADLAGNTLAAPHAFEFYYASGTSGGDNFGIRLAPGGAGSIEITEGTTTHTVPRAALALIALDPLAGNDVVHLDFSAGIDWMPPQGLSIGATESARVSGAAAGPTFTFAGNLLASAGWNVDFTGVQSLALSGGKFTIATDLAGRALQLDAGAVASAQATLRLDTVAIAGGASLNLNDNDLVVRNTPLADIDALIAADALTSALFDGSGLTALASASANMIFDLPGPGDTAIFSGQTVYASDVLVKYTYGGDSNMDGKLDADDYGSIDFNVLVAGSLGYCNGDFNRDGKIDADDYGTIDFNILAQGAPL